MKKIALLNQPMSSVIAGLGHVDTLVICCWLAHPAGDAAP